MAHLSGDVDQRPARVRSFALQRVPTLSGEGVRLIFGPYIFVLVNRDGTPERSLDKAGLQRVVEAVFMVGTGGDTDDSPLATSGHG